MTVFQDHLYNDPTEGFFQPNPHTAMFSPLGVYTNPPPPVPPFLLILNQSPKEIAGNDITNCLTHIQCTLKHLKLHASYVDIGGLTDTKLCRDISRLFKTILFN